MNHKLDKNMNQKFKRTRQIIIALVLIAAAGGLSSCEKYSFLPPRINPDLTVHFSTEIQPIFTSNCVACHGGLQFPNLSEGKSYNSLTKAGFVNTPGETSRLYLQMTSSSHTSRSTDIDKQKVLNWINQGALNN
jgi:hypothetical protein